MSNTICIYHANCADGFTAAWAVYKALGPDIEYYPGFYDKPPPDVKGKHVIMVDFSYKRPVLEAMAAGCETMVVLDHHKTARDDLAGYPGPGAFYNQGDIMEFDRDFGNTTKIHALFDMERSGAGIAWDYFHKGLERPNIVSYVEDRDLWKFKLTNSRELNAYIFAHEYTFENWNELDDSFEDLSWAFSNGARMGAAILKKQDKDTKELVIALRRRMRIGNVVVWGASIPYTMTSEAGNMMSQDEPFAACYWDTSTGREFSLRSTLSGMDVSEIAKFYGGGGHARAAGFKVPLSRIGEFEL